MRSAYESHGGGIRGVAAAAIEGVKGIYTAGFSFLDNLTGGKLTEIKNKFVTSVSNIASGVAERVHSRQDGVHERHQRREEHRLKCRELVL